MREKGGFWRCLTNVNAAIDVFFGDKNAWFELSVANRSRKLRRTLFEKSRAPTFAIGAK